MRIFLSGGGTGGSVTPLLALAEEIKKREPQAEFLFVGTRRGKPEKQLAQTAGFAFISIFSAKLRRYLDWRNLFTFLGFIAGFVQSLFLVSKRKPKAILSVGGFVSVPLAWAGALLGTPVFVHQQDIIPGLANRLMAPLARKITVAFPPSLDYFPKKKTVLTGNPVRPEVLRGDRAKARQIFNLEKDVPTVLIMGGGTGALKINRVVVEAAPKLTQFCQVVHLTGQGKQTDQLSLPRYRSYPFLTDRLPHLYQAADVIVSRAGLASLTELANLGKPAILIPIADSHQEANARYFAEQRAAYLLPEAGLNPSSLTKQIHQLIFSAQQRSLLSLNIGKLARPRAGEEIAQLILQEIL